MAATGGGSTDNIVAFSGSTSELAIMGQYQMYDQFAIIGVDGSVVPQLAESIEPNKDGTEWTIRLLDGVTFHDGQPLDSAAALTSLKMMATQSCCSAEFTLVDVMGAKVLDSRTVRVPMHKPYFAFPARLAGVPWPVVAANFDPKHPGRPNGTGPFKYVSFTPGRQMVFERDPNYRESGKPYLDRVVINYATDETAQVNALLSGQANTANSFSLGSVEALKSGGLKILEGSTGGVLPFYMNTSVAPFSDVRVRQAMKLIVDREQMREAVFGPYGSIANDTWVPPFDPLYLALPQRQQDLEQAKSLLAQAGHSGLRSSSRARRSGRGSRRWRRCSRSRRRAQALT
jgi:peptide/nickel transport system substrate-binding protein